MAQNIISGTHLRNVTREMLKHVSKLLRINEPKHASKVSVSWVFPCRSPEEKRRAQGTFTIKNHSHVRGITLVLTGPDGSAS